LDRIKNPKDKSDYNYISRVINYIEENADLLQKIAIYTNEHPDATTLTYNKDGIDVQVNIKNI